ATTARAAGAVRDRVRFERAAAEVLRLAVSGSEMAASSVYHVAEGARCFEQWDRSAELARESIKLGMMWGNKSVLELATRLLAGLSLRDPGDMDTVPPEGGEVDEVVALLLKRLRKHTAPRDRRAVPPEQFPVY
ncbi:MAG TPA: hypothetical protein VK358_01350, partial [Longimicrobium sp.]|nr:hypothetical protein [Longimicrobium sp.]